MTIAAPVWRSVERTTIVTPLAIRFWDPAFDVPIVDGLDVVAYPYDARWPATTAFRTRGGLYAFHGLPRMHDVEYPRSSPTGSLPASRRFLVEVNDARQRFLAACFFVDVPFDGVYPSDVVQSLAAQGPPGFYLFSSSTRPATPMTAVVRAQLVERISSTEQRPASYAVLQVTTPQGDMWPGIADARGMVSVLFPCPTFTVASGAGSLPPAGIGPQAWPLAVSVWYQPGALVYPVGSSLPELRTVLSQGAANLWTDSFAPPGEVLGSLSFTLNFAQELVLRTASESVLLVSVGSMT